MGRFLGCLGIAVFAIFGIWAALLLVALRGRGIFLLCYLGVPVANIFSYPGLSLKR
jgi:hypothetical protein